MVLIIKKMNKKGMIFTLLTVALIGLFLASFGVYSIVNDQSSINDRVKTMNDFIDGAKKDLENQLYVSSFRTMFIIQNATLSEEKYFVSSNDVDDLKSEIARIMATGELRAGDPKHNLMTGITLPELQTVLDPYANKFNLGILINDGNPLNENDIIITQDDPWHIKIILTTNIEVTDNDNLAKWEIKNEELIAYLPIRFFLDPVWVINSGEFGDTNAFWHSFNQSEFDPITQRDLHHQSQKYIAADDAPSFLERYAGDFIYATPNPTGIESLVSSHVGGVIASRSRVDYEYFNNINANYDCGVPIIPITAGHKDHYCP
jgi:hypothetical protein